VTAGSIKARLNNGTPSHTRNNLLIGIDIVAQVINAIASNIYKVKRLWRNVLAKIKTNIPRTFARGSTLPSHESEQGEEQSSSASASPKLARALRADKPTLRLSWDDSD